MNLLIHVCCAHCFAKTLAGLRDEYGPALQARGFWYNPNIHPLIEYRRRLKALRVYQERDPVPVDVVDEYGLIPFCTAVHGHYASPERCDICYALRLERTAQYSAENGIKVFTSTLVTSRHQDHQRIQSAGDAAARKYGVEFLYRDLRAVQVPDRLVNNIYHQQYCGCVFSEYDRFATTAKHLYFGDEKEP